MDKKRMVANLVEAIYLAGMFLYMLVLKSVYSVASSYDFLMFICISALIIGILILIGPRFNRYFGFIFAFLYTLYLIAQQVYYRGFGQYFRFSTALGLASEVAGVTDSAIELIHFSDIIPFIVLAVFTIVFVIYPRIVTHAAPSTPIFNQKIAMGLPIIFTQNRTANRS